MKAKEQKTKVVYLLGAGASHACVKHVGSPRGILMADLNGLLRQEVHNLISRKKQKYRSLLNLVNDVIAENTDFEHLITFLDDSPSLIHRQFAEDLRAIFQKTLWGELKAIKNELGNNRFQLYSALLDMYRVNDCPEALQAILTTNYDEYIEEAIKSIYGSAADFGVYSHDYQSVGDSPKLLKLHGSFGWRDAWPIHRNKKNGSKATLWIPPGIQKAKGRYPFNLIWGRARELLDCDVVRVIGCRLSASDWDLISLLFTTRHAHAKKAPYVVEVIDSPTHAFELKKAYPYLEIRSILEIEDMDVGAELVGEYRDGAPKPFYTLSPDEQEEVRKRAGTDENWFHVWLKQMAEAFERKRLGAAKTTKGEFSKLLGEA